MSASVKHFGRLERSCLNANISRLLDCHIEIESPGTAKVLIPFNPALTQNADLLHGAILFEAADTAAFFAANSLEETFSVLTADFCISFLRPVRGEGIYAIGHVLKSGKRLIIVRSDVYSDGGKLVAAGQGTYIVTTLRLDAIPGYLDE